ncbi:hypothetical protein [Citrobacter freundii]|uniref:hypothetical protein n=1 Tax=Citrobacter freundii TaxID=546 RepID=UPI001FFDF4E4|nr:hypothetical protein [Citrobacter freundii]
MATIVNTKLGEHRGKKRVWLEGQKLLREGYYPGMKYDLELKDSQVVLRVKEEGKFTISKRERNGRVSPIIDLTVQELATVFDGVEMCQQRVKSDPLTATTNGLILIHLVYSGLASAITPAFRFCFSR